MNTLIRIFFIAITAEIPELYDTDRIRKPGTPDTNISSKWVFEMLTFSIALCDSFS